MATSMIQQELHKTVEQETTKAIKNCINGVDKQDPNSSINRAYAALEQRFYGTHDISKLGVLLPTSSPIET